MSSISFLDSSNFVLIGNQNKSLGVNISGPLLVFFKMPSSPPCQEFEPTFAKLSGTDKRVSYGVIDVQRHKDVVLWSRNTSTPITGVPILILYLNGKPHAKFNGTKNIPSLQNFISQALQTVSAPSGQKSFMPSGTGRGDNMYGGGAPPPMDPRYQMAGSQGQYPGGASPPGGTPSPGKNMPEIGRAPSMKGVLKGAGPPAGYSVGGNYVEDDDNPRLMVPDSVTPWNAPWEAELQQNY